MYELDLKAPHALNMEDVFLQAIEELALPYPSIQLNDWPMFNRVTGGLRPKEFSILCGSTGCISGETMISIHRAGKGSKIAIQDLYKNHTGIGDPHFDKNIETFIRSFDGSSIRLHKIKDVFLSGIKETWRLKTNQNKSIRVTPCHKILTRRGWVPAKDLLSTDFVAMDVNKPRKRLTQKAKIYDSYFGRIKFHPFSTKCNDDRRIVSHRAILEASMNNVSLECFLHEIRTNPLAKSLYRFIDPKKFHIHHKDHNHFNNEIYNLEAVEIAEHFLHHGNNANFNQGQIQWVQYLGYDRIGVESVYDIECEDPYRNFVANSFVVHNSGKTTMLANISAQLLKQNVKHFVMSVETGHTDFMKRILSVLAGKDLNSGDAIPVDLISKITAENSRILGSGCIEFSLYDNRLPVEQLMHDMEYMQRKGCKIAMLDNINFFMEVTSAANQVVEMDRVIHELIIFCKRIDMHLILVMHPKKTSGAGTRVESEYDIKGSSTAVQEAHNVFLFNRPDPKEAGSDQRDREFKIAKMRRRGGYVGNALIFSNQGTKYLEKGLK